MTHHHRVLFKFELLKLLLIDLSMAVWLLYGNTIYFSKQNDCDRFEGTQGLNNAMLVVLMVGWLQLLTLFLVLLFVPCFFLYFRGVSDLRNHEIVQA